MDWFENKTTQLIALVSIVGTLAGFGYTGATYVNRLENLEAEIVGIDDTENAQQAIEERFVAIETSVEYINKSIDEGINPSLKTIAEASQRGLITSGHIPFTVQLDQTLDAGIGAIEHLYYILKGCSSREDSITEAIIKGDENFWSSMPKLLKTYEPLRAQNVFDKLVQADTYVVPTLRISEVLSQLDVDNHFDDVYLKVMPQELLKTYENRVLGFLE